MISAPPNVADTAAYGLFATGDFRLTTGRCSDCATIPQALWFFRDECIAVPRPGLPIAGFDPARRADDDLRRWNSRTPPGAARDYPALVWVASPQTIDAARIDHRGDRLRTASAEVPLALAPRLASNRSWANRQSIAFLSRRQLRLRGTWVDGQRFVARSLWPADFRVDPAAPLQPIAASAQAIRAFVRSEPDGGARGDFLTRLVWQRDPAAAQRRAGRALIAIMLNGAQGDDDEAHAGHFGLVTGRVGAQGQMHDWLIANYYTLATHSEKGIIAAQLPLDGYLADVNSGQSWYRPSYMLVATLRDERCAAHLSAALARVFNQFYRHQFVYQHAAANCAGICLSTLRAIGWQVPTLGASSWLKAVVGLPAVALRSGSLTEGKAIFDYLTEERTRLLPALAFEQAGADLLRLVGGESTRRLTTYEALLRDDVEEILLLRIPQLPSSRAWGCYPVASIDEYRERLPRDPAKRQVVPVGPRPFPRELKDPTAPAQRALRSDYAVAAYGAAVLLFAILALRACWRRTARARDE